MPPPGARSVRLDPAPSISVVVASSRERGQLEACLASLLPECDRHGVEVVVARCMAAEELGVLQDAYPSVCFVAPQDAATALPLRKAGMLAATGDIVVLTEDDRVRVSDWLARLIAPYGNGAGEGHGPARNGSASLPVDWAALLSDHASFNENGGPRASRWARWRSILNGHA